METHLVDRIVRPAWIVFVSRWVLMAALGWHAIAVAREPADALRFGVLPIGGAVESKDGWAPLLADLARAVGRPVTVLSVTSYESLDQAIDRDEVDLALLSSKMALDAVTEQRMNVLALVKRHAGDADHRAILLARKDGPRGSLDDLLAHPDRWRLARGDSRSVSGFILPQVQLFLPHRIEMETRFKSEVVGTHQATALAVANGDADVATNNTTDFDRFRRQFPVEAGRLQIIWRSDPTPQAPIVVRRELPPELQKKLRAFFVGYGREPGVRGNVQRETLKDLHASLGYVAADNKALLPAARLEYQLARQSALNARWVSEEARQAKLDRIEQAYVRQQSVLRADGR
ncbi:phosphonate transport system substrate-binding protein [Variovorax sp. Sphag1AA]|nr:phosphate/phosphite/phosphonate ABC transporter substrate-binding protein [Variovorax sp. Sphag1AA]MBB3180780.1 phosphonate transport system substrate-binding protein [Variovorax sp. Sphag1AA]